MLQIKCSWMFYMQPLNAELFPNLCVFVSWSPQIILIRNITHARTTFTIMNTLIVMGVMRTLKFVRWNRISRHIFSWRYDISFCGASVYAHTTQKDPTLLASQLWSSRRCSCRCTHTYTHLHINVKRHFVCITIRTNIMLYMLHL